MPDLVQLLQAHGVAAAMVATSADVTNDPQLAARRYWHTVSHAEMGVGVIWIEGQYPQVLALGRLEAPILVVYDSAAVIGCAVRRVYDKCLLVGPLGILHPARFIVEMGEMAAGRRAIRKKVPGLKI